MNLVIRLKGPFNSKGSKIFKVVLIKKSKAQNGESVLTLGSYAPATKSQQLKYVNLNLTKLKEAVSQGAELSPKVAKLLLDSNVLSVNDN